MARSPRGEGGFSAVEALVSVAVTGLLIGGVLSMVDYAQSTHVTLVRDVSLRQQTRNPLALLRREISLAGHQVGALPQVLSVATPTELEFAADVDLGDPSVPCTNESPSMPVPERISYRTVEGLLQRRVECLKGGTWMAEQDYSDLATDLVTHSTPVFRYFDSDGNELSGSKVGLSQSQRKRVTAILVTLNARDEDSQRLVGTSPYPRAWFRTLIRLRNRDLPEFAVGGK